MHFVIATTVFDVAFLIAVVAFVVYVWYFRKEIKALLARATALGAGYRDAHVQAQFGEADESIAESKTDGEADPEVDRADESEPAAAVLEAAGQESSEAQPADLRGELLRAATSGDRDAAERIFEELQRAETDPVIAKLDAARWSLIRVLFLTDPGGLDALEKAVEDPEIGRQAALWLGMAYESAREYGKATEAFERARDAATTADERTEAVVRIANALRLDGNESKALTLLKSQLHDDESGSGRCQLYEQMASVYGDGKPVLRALALDQAASADPARSDLRFNAAWNYSKVSGLEPVAVHHYHGLLDVDPGDSASHNNLGVLLKELRMPFSAVDRYKRASAGDHTLAMANLAWLYIDAGFRDEARNVIEKAQKADKPHANVTSAAEALASRDRDEKSTQEEVEAEGARQAGFLRCFGQAVFESAVDELEAFIGTWRSPTGETLVFERADDRLVTEWQEGRRKKRRLRSQEQNPGFLRYEEMGYSILDSSKETSYEDKGSAYLYLVNANEAQLMILRDESVIWTLTREADV